MISDPKIKEEIKKIWLGKKDEMKTSQIYKTFLGGYFNVANYAKTDRDWMSFLILVKEWKKEIRDREMEEQAEEAAIGLSDEEADELQERNRKKMIFILNKLIEEYEMSDNPAKKSFSIGEIRRMYNSIQSLEEKIKMTEISRGKLKLEAVKTLLPYQRMSLPDIMRLKEQLNDSFERIIKLKSGEPVGADTPLDG